MNALKKKIGQIVEMCEEVPEIYRVKCFGVILQKYLEDLHLGSEPIRPAKVETSIGDESEDNDIGKKLFFEDHEINIKQVNKILHNKNGKWQIIVKNTGKTNKADAQIALALLMGIANLLSEGKAEVLKGELVDICKRYSKFDSANFRSIMKRRLDLFGNYDKKTKGWELTKPGEEAAAEYIKNLLLDMQN